MGLEDILFQRLIMFHHLLIHTLFKDIDELNRQLADWCIFYNTKRPHHSHRKPNNRTIQIPPLKAYIYMLKLDQGKSNMLWTHTNS